jgi:hypothetical protein
MESDLYYYTVGRSMPSNGIGISSPGGRSARVSRLVIFLSRTIYFGDDGRTVVVRRAVHPVQ